MRTDQEFSQYASIGEFPGQSLVTRYQASEDPTEGTAQTVNSMCSAALRDCHSPQVMRAAGIALLFAGPSEVEKVQGIYDWIARSVKFRQDEPVLRYTLGLDEELDLLIAPARLLTMSRPAGDCDDFTMLTCAMLLAAGIPCEIVTIKADQSQPWRYSHVYAQAITDQGIIPMDCSQAAQHGYPLGWEPQAGVLERKAWGAMNPPQIGTGLAGYTGLGDCDADMLDMGLCTDTSTLGTTSPSSSGVIPVPGYGCASYNADGTCAGGSAPIPLGSTPSSSGSFNPTALLTSLAADATAIGKQLTLPTGYSLSPTGAVVAPLNLSTLFGQGSGGLLLIGGGILLLVLLAGGGKR